MASDTVRIALISTPRSGNTWLRRILAKVLQLAEFGAHRPGDLDWQALPNRVILQIHWLPDAEFSSLLNQHCFQRIVLARHPLDVLISILSFSQHESATRHWLDGAGGDESILEGASPMSDAFRAYATGPRAKKLLSISATWWDIAGGCRVRYEDLLRDTAVQISTILNTLGLLACIPVEDAISQSTPEHMRAVSVNHLYHVWQARPGAWTQLLTARAAAEIEESNQDVFDALGYTCATNNALQSADAQLAWDRNGNAALKRVVYGIKDVLTETEGRRALDLSQLRAEIQNQQSQVQSLNAELQAVERSTSQKQQACEQELEQLRAEIQNQHSQVRSLIAELQAVATSSSRIQQVCEQELEQSRAEIQNQQSQVQGLNAELQAVATSSCRTQQAYDQELEQIRAEFQNQQLQVQSLIAELQAVETSSRRKQQACEQALEQSRADVEVLRREFASLPHEQFRELAQIGPRSFAMVRRLRRWSRQLSRITDKFKSLAMPFRSR